MTHKALVVFSVFGLIGSGCGMPSNFSKQQSAADSAGIAEPGVKDGVPECLVDIPHMLLFGNVNAFEFAGGGGIMFGYSPQGNHNGVSVTASIHVEVSQMDLTMVGAHPLSNETIASTTVDSDQTRTNINATIDFKNFSVNPYLFFSTPLAQVSQKGLQLGVSDVKKQMDAKPWSGNIIKIINNNRVLINAGDTAGIREGDVLDVFSVEHFWDGTPCNSAYLGSQLSAQPIAQIKMAAPMQNSASSVGTVVSGSTEDIHRGAFVFTNKLVGDPKKRYLKKKILLGRIHAKSFTVPGGEQFDFEWAMNSEIVDVLNKAQAFVFEVKP